LNNILSFTNQYIISQENEVLNIAINWTFEKINTFFQNHLIDSQIDQDVIIPFTKDWSNIPDGHANILVRPNSEEQCAIILKTCQVCKIPITISAGRTNLTGSATPFGGIVLSIQNLIRPNINVDTTNLTVVAPVGIPLELMRDEILKQSKYTLYYPVDPTSRHDAFVGGTLSCNASGFMPGEKGATRFWVEEIEFMLLNGYSIKIKRGEYISHNGEFILKCGDENIILPIPRYNRPNIKNASGLYSSINGEIDFIDLVIGSEGILGLIISAKFNLAKKPTSSLDLFIRLKNENSAIEFHHYLYKYLNSDMGKITALEYFGYNCQNYMKHKNFLFNDDLEVGIYLQIPIYGNNYDTMVVEWSTLINKFDSSIDFDNIIILNDNLNWKRFFEARHSLPDNALRKTREKGGVSIITDTIVPPQKIDKYLTTIHAKLRESNIEYLLFGHLGDCHLHFHLIPDASQEKQSLDIYNFMIDLSSKLGGVYSAEHGTGKRKKTDFKKCYGDEAVQMIINLKKSLDPDLLLNKGNIV
tara:strand:- start:16513 stop:18099 length:1587 start_codon:yes stop_codon:yes gene_type:complete